MSKSALDLNDRRATASEGSVEVEGGGGEGTRGVVEGRERVRRRRTRERKCLWGERVEVWIGVGIVGERMREWGLVLFCFV